VTGGGPARIRVEALPAGLRGVLERLSALLGSEPAWLIGGAVRDALLGEAVSEADVAVTRGALALGRGLADAVPGAAFVALDEERGICRVLCGVQVDIADLRAPTLDDDLRGRDFTVNALAVPLHDLVRRGEARVEDATGGLGDLAARVARPCSPGAIRDDPVRALRGVRLAIGPGWRLHPSGEAAIQASASLVASVAAERARDEIAAILSRPNAGAGLRLLDRLGVLPSLLPESAAMRSTPQPEPHRFDVWEHSMRAVESMDEVLGDLAGLGQDERGLEAHLDEALGDGFARREVLKLAALLHDVAKPETRRAHGGRIRFLGHDVLGAERAGAVARRWRLSRRATTVLERLVAEHLRPMHLAAAGEVTRRARYRFFRDLGDEARDLVLLALADASAVRGEAPLAVWRGSGGAILHELMRGAREEGRAAETPALVRGEDVMAAFSLAPGPAVGRLLARAREAQALGLVRSRSEALEYLRQSALDQGYDMSPVDDRRPEADGE